MDQGAAPAAEILNSGYHDVMAETQIQLTEEQPDGDSRAQRFLNAAGSFRSGLRDVSENHDEYLAEEFAS